jgi:hypothetical protein
MKTYPHCTFYQIPDLFSLRITFNKQATKMKMALFGERVNTKDIPYTSSLLDRYLPSVLYSTCFNDQQLPFSIEVRSTEVGHLFEHILLEYLCYFKLSDGSENAEYSGVTNWNWEEDPWGVFHITINCGCKETEIFSKALQQSLLLLQLILNSTPNSIPALPRPQVNTPISPLFDHLDR